MLVGYHAVYDKSFYDGIEYASKHEFDYIQFDLNVPRYYLDQMTKTELKAIRTYAEQRDIRISLHAPGDNISLYTDYPLIRKAIIEHLLMIIEKAKLLNARHLTLHPSTYPAFRKSGAENDDFEKEYGSYYANILYENLKTLVQAAEGLLLCVENYGFSEITRRTLRRLFDQGIPIYLTWDFSKSRGKEHVERFMLQYQDLIREVHVHDSKIGFQSHLTVGSGDMDFSRFLHLMNNPRIATTIEVRPREQANISRKQLLKLIKNNESRV